MSKQLTGVITITFPDSTKYDVPLQLVQQHRAAYFRRVQPGKNWWRSPSAQDIEQWLTNKMKWSQLSHHVKPSPGNRLNRYCDNRWRNGAFTLQTNLDD